MNISAFNHLKELGVLGMNSRNSDYIMRCNPRSAFPLVDNKVMTKRLAAEHKIPIPTVFHLIEHHGDIAKLETKIAGKQAFVVKPARGAGGQGIILITDRKDQSYVTAGGRILSKADLAFHISDILSGVYSLSGLDDTAIIEALLNPDPVFAQVTYSGVPDIRIVVYRGVPLMAMVRLPTKASDGKANLHRGAIAAGINIASGKTMTAVYHSDVITHHPDTGNPVVNIQVPYWKPMLLIAASAFDMTGLGYIGVDLVIDSVRGPVLLELNARPGLAIQIANLAGLRQRLDRVDEAPSAVFSNAETRVSWATQTFG
jgi:alpha-L-glutamate ligase-like protein